MRVAVAAGRAREGKRKGIQGYRYAEVRFLQTWARHCRTSRSCGIGIGVIRDEEMRQDDGEKAVESLVYSCMERRTGVPDDGAPSLLEDAPHTAVRKDAPDGRDPETAIQLCDAAGGKSLKDVEGPLVGRVGERVSLNFGFDEIDRVDESPTGDSGYGVGVGNQLSMRLERYLGRSGEGNLPTDPERKVVTAVGTFSKRSARE